MIPDVKICIQKKTNERKYRKSEHSDADLSTDVHK